MDGETPPAASASDDKAKADLAAVTPDEKAETENADVVAPEQKVKLEVKQEEEDGTPWLRQEDLLEEDIERNREQAARNIRMREKLRKKRLEKQAQAEMPGLDFEDFMPVGQSAKKTVVNESLPPWFEERGYIENSVLRLHEEMLDFTRFMRPSQVEIEARRSWVRTVAICARSLWPTCEVRIFGSFFSSLALPNADVDIALLNVPCKPATAMKLLADRMLEDNEISWLEIIASAKVPVAKIRSQSCGLRADVVVNQPDGIKTSQFIRDRCKEYPQMKQLLIFLKYFLQQRGLHETYTGGMGSYLLCNVVLHFLQRHPARKDKQLYAATSLGHLLFDFFRYYGKEFRYETQAISLLNGGRVFNKSERGKGGGKGKKGGIALCLESPLDPSVDLGGPCFRMSVLKNLFNHAFHCLSFLFATKASPDASMLCPFLLDPGHAVITDRHKLMTEQPVALPGLKRANDYMDAVAEEGGLPSPEDAPMAKRQKTTGSDDAAADGDKPDGFVPLGASEESA